MRVWAAFALSCFLGAGVQGAQNRAAPASDLSALSSSRANIDPAKEADIRHLLDVVGTTALVQQMMTTMEKSLKPLVANALPPGEYRDRLTDLFFEKFRSKFDTKRLLDFAVARYDENFSDEEIKGLLEFYQTPLGRKVVAVLPQMTAELQEDGRKLGQDIGRDSMLEVLSEHPDIAQALKEASRRAATPNQ
ncbi:MAG TPA: DUF2059 domain-containing protein [Candidatus Acidoferrales bacterium]|nr:DUF2059 domain-containing protein [Candidatus Acidoferrales bacterium]